MNNSIITELDFADKRLAEKLLTEVREDPWGDLRKETVVALKKLLETTMEIEVQDLIGNKFCKHNADRITFRKGSHTSFCYIAMINAPRVMERW